MASQLQVVNLVLSKLGRKPVQNVNDQADSLLISQQLPLFLEELLLNTLWNFALQFRYDNTPLTTNITANPFGGFLYNYQLPANYGRFAFFEYTNFPPFGVPYAIADGVLLTNTRPIIYWYVVNDVDYAVLPAPFVQALVYSTAWQVCLPLTQNQILTDKLEAMWERKLGDAIQQNAMEQPIMQVPFNDFNRRIYI
jgi:hypothetical protein